MSFDIDIRTKAVQSTATVSAVPIAKSARLSVQIHATTKPIVGWAMYPFLKLDLIRRERRRVEGVKRLMETGELTAEQAFPLS